MSLLRRSARPERNLFTVHETRPTPKSLGRVACLMALALLFVGVRQVQADIVDFEGCSTFRQGVSSNHCLGGNTDVNFTSDRSFAIGGNSFGSGPFPGTPTFIIGPQGIQPNGTSTILWTSPGAVVTLTNADLSPFDLLSADLGEVGNDDVFHTGTTADAIVVKGFRLGIAGQFSMVTIPLFEPFILANEFSFQNERFDNLPGLAPQAFQNLTSVTFQGICD
jgi:hypothetical protein